jgi:uncharacterized protein YjbI with pentapeptide repeats
MKDSPVTRRIQKTNSSPAAPKLPAVLLTAELPAHDFTDDAVRQSIDYVGLTITPQHVESIEVERCRFSDTKLANVQLNKSTLSDIALSGCDLANLSATNSSLVNSTVSDCRLTGTSWSNGVLREVLFESCRANLAKFRFSRFKRTVFHNCDLQQADFQNADLRSVSFENCDLTSAQFSNALMDGARFSDCRLLGINGVTSLKGAIVRSDDLPSLAQSLAHALGIIIED